MINFINKVVRKTFSYKIRIFGNFCFFLLRCFDDEGSTKEQLTKTCQSHTMMQLYGVQSLQSSLWLQCAFMLFDSELPFQTTVIQQRRTNYSITYFNLFDYNQGLKAKILKGKEVTNGAKNNPSNFHCKTRSFILLFPPLHLK